MPYLWFYYTTSAYYIDFATSQVAFSNANHIASSTRTVSSYAITKKGKYYIFINADVNLLGNDTGNANISIYKNDSIEQQVYFNNPQRAYFVGGVQLSTIMDCVVGDNIYIKAECPQNDFSINTDINRSNLNIVRISG